MSFFAVSNDKAIDNNTNSKSSDWFFDSSTASRLVNGVYDRFIKELDSRNEWEIVGKKTAARMNGVMFLARVFTLLEKPATGIANVIVGFFTASPKRMGRGALQCTLGLVIAVIMIVWHFLDAIVDSLLGLHYGGEDAPGSCTVKSYKHELQKQRDTKLWA